jgi:hypothetical protein
MNTEESNKAEHAFILLTSRAQSLAHVAASLATSPEDLTSRLTSQVQKTLEDIGGTCFAEYRIVGIEQPQSGETLRGYLDLLVKFNDGSSLAIEIDRSNKQRSVLKLQHAARKIQAIPVWIRWFGQLLLYPPVPLRVIDIRQTCSNFASAQYQRLARQGERSMTPQDAHRVISAIADGIDPNTGELVNDDSLLNSPNIIRALNIALRVLEAGFSDNQQGPSTVKPGMMARIPSNAGKSWSATEDHELVASFDLGHSIGELAKKHDRTNGSIRSRLTRLGRITESPSSDA